MGSNTPGRVGRDRDQEIIPMKIQKVDADFFNETRPRRDCLIFRCVRISINSKFTDTFTDTQTDIHTNRHLAVCTLTTLCRVQDDQDSDQDNQDSHQDG